MAISDISSCPNNILSLLLLRGPLLLFLVALLPLCPSLAACFAWCRSWLFFDAGAFCHDVYSTDHTHILQPCACCKCGIESLVEWANLLKLRSALRCT